MGRKKIRVSKKRVCFNPDCMNPVHEKDRHDLFLACLFPIHFGKSHRHNTCSPCCHLAGSSYHNRKDRRAKLLKSPGRRSLVQSVVSVVECVCHAPSESDESELGTVPHPTMESPPGSHSGSPCNHTREGMEKRSVAVSNPSYQSSQVRVIHCILCSI